MKEVWTPTEIERVRRTKKKNLIKKRNLTFVNILVIKFVVEKMTK